MTLTRPTRRQALKISAAAATAIAAPYIHTAHSAGALSLGLWDHWVPGANDVMRQICIDWGTANNVAVNVDFITSIGNKLLLTAQAESRAETGHDIYCTPLWMPSILRDSLEPVDDVVGEIIARHGELAPAAQQLAQLDGTWKAAPAPTGSLTYASVSRLDLYKQHTGIDLQAMFPAGDRTPGAADAWTYDTFLAAAEKLHAAGHPFGAPIAPTPDGSQWLGQTFAAFGAVLVDAAGDITVDSDQTRTVLDYLSRLARFMDPGVYAWDDAGNNRWMISGKGSTIFNPPSAWAVAKRDNPDVAQHIWHHDTPLGPAGRYRAGAPFFWGIWQFSSNKTAAKDLLLAVAARDVVDRMLRASQGFDVPLISAYARDNDVWTAATPPAGVLYNYPIRGDEQQVAAGYPAPANVGAQIFAQGILPNFVARVTEGGETFDDAIFWAEDEIAGLMRG